MKYVLSIGSKTLPPNLKIFMHQVCDKGARSWLNASPIKEQNLEMLCVFVTMRD